MGWTSHVSLLLVMASANADPCPPNYSQGSDGGDCYRIRSYYDYFATQYTPKSFDNVEVDCNRDYGGLLASIRSEEESLAIRSIPCDGLGRNFGLRCKGTNCKWDDGAPMTYFNFRGAGPSDDNTVRCYGEDGREPPGTWIERPCGLQTNWCWVCRVKARTIECADGETAYKGGCVSLHAAPLDQQSAEAACPGGGHLVSIHSGTESNLYKNIALDAGYNGTIYIGGQYSNGLFEWTDRTYYGFTNWAKGFPNTVFGTCVQMLLASEFGNAGQWTNIDCSTKQSYMCFRDGYDPDVPLGPKADAICPPVQYYTGSDNIYSPNFPLSIPGQQSCEYVIGVNEGEAPLVTFPLYDCKAGTSLALFDGLNSNEPFVTFTNTTPSVVGYNPKSNVLKMVFTTTDAAAGTGKLKKLNSDPFEHKLERDYNKV